MKLHVLPMVGLAAAGLLPVGRAGAAPAAPRGAAAPPRTLALVGVTQIGNRSQAWLVDLRTQRREPVSPGERVSGYTVQRVEPDRVILTRGGRRFTVRLGEGTAALAARAVREAAAGAPAARRSRFHARRVRPLPPPDSVPESAGGTLGDGVVGGPWPFGRGGGAYSDVNTPAAERPSAASGAVDAGAAPPGGAPAATASDSPAGNAYPRYPDYGGTPYGAASSYPAPGSPAAPYPGGLPAPTGYPDTGYPGDYSGRYLPAAPSPGDYLNPIVNPGGPYVPMVTRPAGAGGYSGNPQTARRRGGSYDGTPGPASNPQTQRRQNPYQHPYAGPGASPFGGMPQGYSPYSPYSR